MLRSLDVITKAGVNGFHVWDRSNQICVQKAEDSYQRTGIAVRRPAVELIKVRLNKVLTFSGGGVEEKKGSQFRYIKREEQTSTAG